MKKYSDKKRFNAFMEKIKITDDCWIWNGAIKSNGYGVSYDGIRIVIYSAFYLLGFWRGRATSEI